MKIQKLQEARSKSHEAAKALIELAETEKRSMTEEEIKSFDGHTAKCEELRSQITRQELLAKQDAEINAPEARQVDLETPTEQRVEVVKPSEVSMARYVAQYLEWRMTGKNVETRQPAVFNSENTAADGSVLLPVGVSDVMALYYESDVIKRVMKIPVAGQTLNLLFQNYVKRGDTIKAIPHDGAEKEPTTLQWSSRALVMQTYASLIPVSDELLEDAPSVAVQVTAAQKSDLAATIEYNILCGAGSFTGVVGDAAVVDVGRAAAGAISRLDTANMFEHLCPRGLTSNLAWFYHPSAYSQLEAIRDLNGIYIEGRPMVSIYGIPLVASPFLPQLGTTGDLILADLSLFYAMGIKGDAGQGKLAVSPHLWFNRDLTAFRLTTRLAGAPRQLGQAIESGCDGAFFAYSYAVELAEHGHTGGTGESPNVPAA